MADFLDVPAFDGPGIFARASDAAWLSHVEARARNTHTRCVLMCDNPHARADAAWRRCLHHSQKPEVVAERKRLKADAKRAAAEGGTAGGADGGGGGGGEPQAGQKRKQQDDSRGGVKAARGGGGGGADAAQRGAPAQKGKGGAAPHAGPGGGGGGAPAAKGKDAKSAKRAEAEEEARVSGKNMGRRRRANVRAAARITLAMPSRRCWHARVLRGLWR
jgi:hypothetical protein